eukprot:2958262-Rhodomonas_salina.3
MGARAASQQVEATRTALDPVRSLRFLSGSDCITQLNLPDPSTFSPRLTHADSQTESLASRRRSRVP